MMNRNILNPMMWTTGSWPTPPSPVSPWIYWNASRGLISLSSDWASWTTIADKNLGATEVYNYWDTLSQNNCWNYYQRWNNYGFPFSGEYTKRAWYVTARNYGPYYESSTFISTTWNWILIDNPNLWWDIVGTNNSRQWPAPNGYHVPSGDELLTLRDILINIEPISTSALRDYQTRLRLPLSWFRYYGTPQEITNVGEQAWIWSTTEDVTTNSVSLTFWFYTMQRWSTMREIALNIRCFKNNIATPDNTWDTIYESWSKWVYRNETLGLITITDWLNTITMQDKNLWARVPYTYGDTLSEDNCGFYYQRWNNYGFPGIWNASTIQTSTTKVDASNYWPYYYWTTFYTPFNGSRLYWDDSHNKNLRWWVTNTLKAMRWPCQEWYHVPNKIEFEGLWNTLQWLWLPKNWMTTRDYLKIPRAWYISNLSWQIIRVWEYCIVWTATAGTLDNSSWADDIGSVNEISRMVWANIRPFLNNSVTPDSTWTKLF